MHGDGDETTRLRRTNRLIVGLVLLTVGPIIFLATLGGAYVLATYQTAEYKCIVEGPHSPLAEISEDSTILRDARFSVWPLGRECEWRRADGAGWVTADSGNWPGTAVLLASGAATATGILLAISAIPARRRPPNLGAAV
jgi:hypothetical protein